MTPRNSMEALELLLRLKSDIGPIMDHVRRDWAPPRRIVSPGASAAVDALAATLDVAIDAMRADAGA